MARVAPLSYTSQFGYYGLRVNPTFDQALGTIRKPYGIPVPDRSSKWYALSPYRALILDAEAKYNSHEHAKIDYQQSDHELPQRAAAVRPSDAGQDPTFDTLDQQHHDREAKEAYDTAAELMNQEHQQQTAEARTAYLSQSHGANHMHPVIEASHDELDEASAPHIMPGPRLAPANPRYRAPTPAFVAAGQPQAPEFPPFEHLNQGQPSRLNQGHLSTSQNLTYERMRDFVVEPTWSS